MNKVELCGRLVRDPQVSYSSGENQMAIARFTLAVDRRGKKTEGQPEADFISCLAFGKTAEHIEKYYKKGLKALVVGHLQTGSYKNKDGQTVYTTDVVIEETEFAESKSAASSDTQGTRTEPKEETKAETANDGFMEIPSVGDDEFPFQV